ncbi:TetR/AcrR family transcriptional regulator [Hamadaea sp. NPDC050747]|uniref:TetR/AcrR family transcriptional regulator n=1 Tax=Hamadaea sp. NPDC050747 TaxID=3155789 RepID=UPI0033D3B2D3
MKTEPNRRRRVPAMAPDDRRAAIIAATIPLLKEHGVLVTTKQIAEAAGVAEGTIFGVFPDKPSLVRAAIMSVFDPAPLERALSAIDPEQDLRGRLVDTAHILVRGLKESGKLIGLIRTAAKGEDDAGEMVGKMKEMRERTFGAVAGVIEPDRQRLRVPTETAAHMLVSLVFAMGQQGLLGQATPQDFQPLDAEQIVSLLLDGLLVRENESPETPDIAAMLLDGWEDEIRDIDLHNTANDTANRSGE